MNYIQEAFRQNWIAPLGENVDKFELELGNYCQSGNVSVVNSGTSALHLAMILLGVKPGDEVLCQSFTFCASVNPITYQGAVPVFIGSERETWNMGPEHLERAIQDRIKQNRKPKAVVLVHLYGVAGKISEIMEICQKYEIPLVEDAAESLGSTYKGRMTGTFGEFGIYSFNGNKIITTSGGGALVGKSKALIDKSRFLATQARDTAPYYLHSEIGFNYRMSNIVAGIGRGQLKVLDKWVEARRSNYSHYCKELSSYGALFCQDNPEGKANRWLTTLLLDKNILDKMDVLTLNSELQKLNIESRPLWNPMHKQPIFKDCKYYGDDLEVTFFQSGLCLPSGSNLTPEERDFVVDGFKALVSAGRS